MNFGNFFSKLFFFSLSHLDQYKRLWTQCASWCLSSQSGTKERGNHPGRRGVRGLQWTEAPQIPVYRTGRKLGSHLKRSGISNNQKIVLLRIQEQDWISITRSISFLSRTLTFTASFSQSWLSSRSRWMNLRETVWPLRAHLLQFKLACGPYPWGYPGDSTHPSSIEEAKWQNRRSRRLRWVTHCKGMGEEEEDEEMQEPQR